MTVRLVLPYHSVRKTLCDSGSSSKVNMLAIGMGAPSYGAGDLTHYGHSVGYSQAATEHGGS